jgi:soluble lytic murein transglycosylase-like protein
MPDFFKYGSMPTDAKQLTSFSVPVTSPAIVCWRSSFKAAWRLCLHSSAVVALFAGVAHAEPVTGFVAVAAETTDRIAESVSEASRRFAIPPAWIWAVMRAESRGDVHALSPKGAMGLMQIMPSTWSELRSRYGLGVDPYDPRDNIVAGAAYLRELRDRYGERGFLAAYNAGPGRYEDHLATGRPLPAETIAYMAAVASLIGLRFDDREKGAASVAPSWTSASIFVSRAATSFARAQSPANARREDGAPAGKAQAPSALALPSDGLFAQTSGRAMRP